MLSCHPVSSWGVSDELYQMYRKQPHSAKSKRYSSDKAKAPLNYQPWASAAIKPQATTVTVWKLTLQSLP